MPEACIISKYLAPMLQLLHVLIIRKCWHILIPKIINCWGEPERAPHWSVVNASVAWMKFYVTNTESPTLDGERSVDEILRYEHGKPHTGWSSYERRTSVLCTKIHSTKTESPTLQYTGVTCK